MLPAPESAELENQGIIEMSDQDMRLIRIQIHPQLWNILLHQRLPTHTSCSGREIQLFRPSSRTRDELEGSRNSGGRMLASQDL